MKVTVAILAAAITGAQAFPAYQLAAELNGKGLRRAGVLGAEFPDNFGIPRDLKNIPFDAKAQLVDIHGDHEWKAPGPNDQRGPCPGLNAAANHNYLPRNGIATRETVINGLHEAYGLGQDATVFLQTTTSFFDGDPISGKWSIGGEATSQTAALGDLQGDLLGKESGICGLGHLKSEGDASITRGDFTQPTGENSNCASYPKFFKQLLDRAKAKNPKDGRITPSVLAAHQNARKLHSIANNPNYFSPVFAGVAFTPAAHDFVYALMANHSVSKSTPYEGGTLTPEALMQWFSYKKKGGELVYTYGHERIPSNFYKRNINDQWHMTDIVAAVAQHCLAYPKTCAVGGNTGTVNSFAGLEVGDISNGLYNAKDLTDPEKLGCFISQNIQAEVPTSLRNVFQGPALTAALDAVTSTLLPALAKGLGECNDVKNKAGVEMGQYRSKYPGLAKQDSSRAKSPSSGGVASIAL